MPVPTFSLTTPALYTDPAFIDRLRRCGAVLTRAIDSACRNAVQGVTPIDLARASERELRDAGARPILLGLEAKGVPAFPAAAAISVNEVAVNGVPGDEPLRDGDVLTIDSACELEGCVCDMARAVVVGGGSSILVEAARAVLRATLGAAQPGRELGELVAAARAEASRLGFDLADETLAHGTGLALHQPPWVLPGDAGTWGGRMEPGMVLAVEPVVVERAARGSGVAQGLRTHADGWSRVAGGRAAYEERTVLVTESGCVELTGSDFVGP